MKNDIYSAAVAAYRTNIITLSELLAYLAEYDLDGVYKSAYMAA